jgi:hypothetical protein
MLVSTTVPCWPGYQCDRFRDQDGRLILSKMPSRSSSGRKGKSLSTMPAIRAFRAALCCSILA